MYLSGKYLQLSLRLILQSDPMLLVTKHWKVKHYEKVSYLIHTQPVDNVVSVVLH